MTRPWNGGQLADDFFLLAHRETDGRPLLGVTVERIGLAGALVGELLLGGLVAIRQGHVCVRDARSSRTRHDPVWHVAMRLIIGQLRPPPVRALVEFLSTRVPDPVVRRLAAAGQIEVRRGLRGTRYPPDQLAGSRPRSLLWGAMRYDGRRRADAPTQQVCVLAGLALHAGLAHHVTMLGSGAEVAVGLHRLVAQAHPEPRLLVDGVAQAIGALAATPTT